jgi:hypothetical protein
MKQFIITDKHLDLIAKAMKFDREQMTAGEAIDDIASLLAKALDLTSMEKDAFYTVCGFIK